MGTVQFGWARLAFVGAILAAIALGVSLRLEDPLSSPVIPAEDPYNHMALVREHIRTGSLDPLNADATLYPPGLHGFLAAVWVFTGVELYDLIRFGPVVLGGIAVLGIGLILGRLEGWVAGFVGALAMAVAPEIILRSTMMSPTALDLAVLPVLFFALVQLLAGRLAWAAPAAIITLFLVFAHPWILLLLGASVLLFLTVYLLHPTRPVDRPLTSRGIGMVAIILGASASLMVSTCGGYCGPGLRVLGGPELPGRMENLVQAGFGVTFLAGLALLGFPTRVDQALRSRAQHPLDPKKQAATSLLLLGLLALVTIPALDRGLPEFVDLPRMLGIPLLALGALAFIGLPFIRGRLNHFGAALVATTYPLVLYAPAEAEFLPHRTVVFFGVGLCLLAGVAAGSMVRVLARSFASRPTSRPAAMAVPALIVALSLGGSVYAGTPDAYPGGWYRLFRPCELDGLRTIAEFANEDPSLLVMTGDWQSKLVLAALVDDASRVWYGSPFFIEPSVRERVMNQFGSNYRPIIAVTDVHLFREHPNANDSFLQQDPWHPLGAWCTTLGIESPRLAAYVYQAAAV
jgi:hypothetical protein